LIGKKVTADMVEPWTWNIAEDGRKGSATALAGVDFILNTATRNVAGFLRQYDVILTPTVASPPPKLGFLDPVNLSYEELGKRVTKFASFTTLFNMTGMPAVSIPLYWNTEGLPVGVQFAGRYAEEATLFRLASQLEKERPWRDRVPPVAR
jgi:Asp-tRNA(Asn)/Glu-tRNA(Gln) amidotransferase A subunit family amidase